MKRLLLFGCAFCLALWTGPALAQSTVFGTDAHQTGFGEALEVEETRVFVGETQSIHTPGRVYIYEEGENGSWTETTFLEADDGEVQDRFGAALDAEGEHLLVGAPSANAVYVMRAGEESWTQETRLTVTDSTTGFGRSVALAENHLFVGTQTTMTVSGSDTTRAAAVHVFEQQKDGTWSESTTLRGGPQSAGTGFAQSLIASSGHLLVSAPRRDGGTVTAYRRDGDEWSRVQTLMASELGGDVRFGSSLRWAGEQVLVGAPLAYSATGIAYTFSYDAEAGSWQRTGRLLPPDGTTNQLFGAALSYDGTDLWVGAPGAQDQAGALYRFERSDSTWAEASRVAHPKATSQHGLGATLAAGEAVVAAGLPGDDNDAGTIALYSPTENDWTRSETIAPQSGEVLTALTGNTRRCEDGKVGVFSCEGLDLEAYLPIREIGGGRGINVNDIWGWTDPRSGTEYALVGRDDGAAFVDVSTPTKPVFVGELPHTDKAQVGTHRDIKVYKDHAFIVSDNAGDHGVQVFDLTQLRDVEPSEMPVTFEQTAHYDKVNSVHNIVINTESGYAYAVGSNSGGRTCGGALHMINIEDPTNPTFAGCFNDTPEGGKQDGIHDSQCVTYNGPDQEYQGHEICLNSSRSAFTIADVTDKDNPKLIASASFPNYGNIHQGWFTESQRYFYMNDEGDEFTDAIKNTRTLIWDLSDLDNPVFSEYKLSTKTSDHNLYVKGDRMYQSNYKSGLRILDISDRENPTEIAHFDTQPFDKNQPGFQGSWSNYPYFESGIIVVSSIGEGMFVLTPSRQEL
jgi:choice-of-anchor B domain-containing protein